MSQLLHRGAFAAAATAVCVVLPLISRGQTPATDLSKMRFDVASFKVTPEEGRNGGGRIAPRPGNQTYEGFNMTLRTYMSVAYQVRDAQIVGGPDWMATERFDMNAKAEKTSTPDELHAMLAHLLEDRFQIKYHRETREQPGFALVVDKAGAKLTEHDASDHVYPPIGGGGPGRMTGTNADMQLLALNLSRLLDKLVVDRTGLSKHYDFIIQDPPPDADVPPTPGPPDPNLINNLLREQLGLRLESTKVPTDYLIIDHVEKLAGN